MIDLSNLVELAFICRFALVLLVICIICILSDSVIRLHYFIWDLKARKAELEHDNSEDESLFELENLEDDCK